MNSREFLILNYRRKILENIRRIYFAKNGRKILIYILELSARGNLISIRIVGNIGSQIWDIVVL
jgi:hypothetical protein